ncbi:MAG: tyrosine-type recombinase/integrase [Phycisphaerae bacterium]|nr:tyrosine-type recombinase/integrase [Phycisphaerae bacterium]
MNDRRIRYLTQREVKRLFARILDTRDKALFDMIYKYGLRVSEATLLTLQDVDFERSKIYIRRVKSGIGGESRIFRDTKRLLKAYLEVRQPTTDSALFTGRQGGLTDKRIAQLFKGYARKARLDPKFSVHSLRHSIATHMFDAGEGVETVQDRLGHVNIQNTMIYARITDKRRRDAFQRLERSTEIVKVE